LLEGLAGRRDFHTPEIGFPFFAKNAGDRLSRLLNDHFIQVRYGQSEAVPQLSGERRLPAAAPAHESDALPFPERWPNRPTKVLHPPQPIRKTGPNVDSFRQDQSFCSSSEARRGVVEAPITETNGGDSLVSQSGAFLG
jgi:hypothetical protein